MAVITKRDIGYTIISRFEEMLREFIASKISVIYPDFKKGIPEGILFRVKEKNYSYIDDLDTCLEYTDFPDLKEIICFNNMYKVYFNNSQYEQKYFIESMQELYTIRCNIAHVRRFFSNHELQSLIEITNQITVECGTIGYGFIEFVMSLNESYDNVIKMPDDFMIKSSDCEIPNNLPTPDYEYEGGFVGRSEDITQVQELIEGNNYNVITIAGAGGVGKTALALRIAQKIIEKKSCPFEGIIWISAKETQLSYLGIEDIEPTIKNYEELLNTILDVMGLYDPDASLEDKEKDVNILFEISKRILIIIDNLETISDQKIVNFILENRPERKILITSRKGLSQVEKRHDLKQLKEKEACYLFRQIAKGKKLDSLAMIDQTIVIKYVKKLSYYPLAIKWVIGLVAIGKDINTVVDSIHETTSDISNFCFEYIFKGLSDNAKKILCSLSYFEDPPTIGIINYIVDVQRVDLEDGIQELILVSLVIQEQSENHHREIVNKYRLLPLTVGYVRQQLNKEPILKSSIEERLRKVETTLEEAERAKHQYRFSLSNLGATSEEEKVAAMIVQTAFQKYQAGDYPDAIADYKKAISIAPRFSSLYRNWAVMESQEGHYIDADKLMKKASEINPGDTQIWLTWGNMKRKEDKIRDAHIYYKKAYDLAPDDYVVLNSLGQAKCRLGEYEEADKLFRLALQKKSSGSSKKHEIINRTSIAENLSRWAELLEQDRQFELEEEKLHDALENIKISLELDQTDIKSNDQFRDIMIKFGYFYKNIKQDLDNALIYFSKAIINKPIRFKEAKDTTIACIQSAKIYEKKGDYLNIQRMLEITYRLRDAQKSIPNANEELKRLYSILESRNYILGKIVTIDIGRGFVIIESSIDGKTYFGHLYQFVPPIDCIKESYIDLKVKFKPFTDQSKSNSRLTAKDITFESL